MKQPSRKAIKTFLNVIEKLDRFEATQRHIRGHGAGIQGSLPVPEVVQVIAWLRELANPLHRHIDQQSASERTE